MGATRRCSAALLFFPFLLAAQGNVNAHLPWRPAVLDQQGKLLAWGQPDKNLGYDKVIRMAWDFIRHKVPRDPKTGLKVYLINSTFSTATLLGNNWQHNPASLYGQFVDSLVAWYAYSGDEDAIPIVREMLDYQLAHGTTPADWQWPGVPFATACGNETEYGRCIQNMPREFYGGVESDKVGELGIGYALFYELTGEKKYLEAALRCAEALARHVREGDAAHTPWPFRLNARTGETLAGEEFGGMVAAPVRLLDEMLRLGSGDASRFRRARDIAWKWLLDHPMNRRSPAYQKWSGYFEDTPHRPDNVNQALPTMTAYHLLTREDPAAIDPQWINHAGQMIDWVRQQFGRGPYFGAWGIDEQAVPGSLGCCSRAGLASDTSRWAAVNALFYERTGDGQAREDAFRSLNYATYFVAADGRITCCGEPYRNPNWFDDGYADYVRNFLWAMGAVPEFAPVGEDHLLRSTSVVRKIAYRRRDIRYETHHPAAVETLRLSFRPSSVTAGGIALDEREDLQEDGYAVKPLSGGDYVVRIRHSRSGQIAVAGR